MENAIGTYVLKALHAMTAADAINVVLKWMEETKISPNYKNRDYENLMKPSLKEKSCRCFESFLSDNLLCKIIWYQQEQFTYQCML